MSETHNDKSNVSEVMERGSTASFDFGDFSFWNTSSQRMDRISSDHQDTLIKYLGDTYNVSMVDISFSFLILYCEESVPSPEPRPFTIAGCIGVWLKVGDDFPLELFPGNISGRIPSPTIEIDEHLASDLAPYQIPKTETLLALASVYFPDAIYISFISNRLIIELPEQTQDDHCRLVDHLPGRISNCALNILYHNGPLVATELKTSKQPESKYLTGVFDDVDYVQEKNNFFPGTMLRSTTGNSISAGILVTKGDQKRLTVAFRRWSEETAQFADEFGNPSCFRVTQGDVSKGTDVGYVAARIGMTDIGLCKLLPDVIFENRFLGMDIMAKSLLHSCKINFGDRFYIDSRVVGLQQLMCLGIRVKSGIGREK